MGNGKSSESNEIFFSSWVNAGYLSWPTATQSLYQYPRKKVKNIYRPNLPTVNFENKSGEGDYSSKPCTFKQCIL